jgi:hypothetical protein
MHQTAKEFMSRNYLWNKIFDNFAGFVDESDLSLATLSGLIRRLKCCREATIKSESLQDPEVFNGPSELGDETPDPFEKLEVPDRGYELLSSALDHAWYLREFCDRFDHYVELLDELDNAGCQLTRDWKDALPGSIRQTYIANASWVEIIFKPRSPQSQQLKSGNLKLKSFLELAIMIGLFPYVEAKIRGKGFPRPQLQSLLLLATRPLEINWRGKANSIIGTASPNVCEMLLQEGADPNCRDTESKAAMMWDEGWTAWTGLLLTRDEDHFPDDVKRWISTVKIFLKYGADPTVADTIITSAWPHKPQYEKDLADIMELLSKAKANLGP